MATNGSVIGDLYRDIHEVPSETQLELLPMVENGLDSTNSCPTNVPEGTGNSTDANDERDYSNLALKILNSKPQYYPPLNFSLVEDGIYRSGFPMPLNYPFIEQLGLKTIIYLGDLGLEKVSKKDEKAKKEKKEKKDKGDYKEESDKPKKDKLGTTEILKGYKEWIATTSIELHHLPMESSQEPFVQTQTQAQDSLTHALQLMLDKNNFPMLIHSNKGKHRIGVLVGLMRKLLQGWCLSGIFEEYEKFALGKSEYDLECIEIWQPELVVDLNSKPDFVRL
ncbi:inositol phosphatase Siw14p [[Candida] railenensis]|uniref:Inositol phosphatase Siw14p n=1 Tax=[Candida] railenensis TaxID=45579 RepID=A0A9P0QRD0_9ASCO|nr:inositol phosphatase Siw14p [[Candida] railenensis]